MHGLAHWLILGAIAFLVGVIIYTCIQALRDKVVFFYNWPDAMLTFTLSTISAFVLYSNLSTLSPLAWISLISVVSLNLYRAHKYNTGGWQVFCVAFSRVIMGFLIPALCIASLFSSSEKKKEELRATRRYFPIILFLALLSLVFGLVNGRRQQRKKEEEQSWQNYEEQYSQQDTEGNTTQKEYTRRRRYSQSKSQNEYRTKYSNQDGRLIHACKVLGVSATDSMEVIKHAYRKLIFKYHPDRAAGMGKKAERRYTKKAQEINTAYEDLEQCKMAEAHV